MDQLPAPIVVVCDGGSGISSATKQSWEGTKTQRCLFHVQAHVRSKLTMNPRLEAGRRLAHLTKNLTTVGTIEEATNWMKALNLWYQTGP